MSCFQIPVSNCEDMRQAIVNHWWGIEEGWKKMHWRSWNWLSTPKDLGGLGFRDMVLFNQAMLAGQGWRLLTDPSSLCARVLKGRYYPDCSFWAAQRPRSSSYTWRSILFGRELLQAGSRWGIGDGSSIRTLSDNWVPGIAADMLQVQVPLSDDHTMSMLLSADGSSWDEDLVRSIFSKDTALKILHVPIGHFCVDDFASWSDRVTT